MQLNALTGDSGRSCGSSANGGRIGDALNKSGESFELLADRAAQEMTTRQCNYPRPNYLKFVLNVISILC